MFHLIQRIIAIFYAYGAIVHGANLLGFGPDVPSDRKAMFTTLDAVFLNVDIAVAIGLWRHRSWSFWLFLAAAGTQVIMYVGFPDYFASSPALRSQITGLLVFHVVTVSVMLLVWRLDT